MVIFDLDREVGELEEIASIEGSLASQLEEDKLMHTVLQGDKKRIDDGRLLAEAVSRGAPLTPDTMMTQLISSWSVAKQIYGEKLLRLVTGYDARALERNLRVPEFEKELRGSISKNVQRLQEEGFVDKEGNVAERGISFATLVMLSDELERLEPYKGGGERTHKSRSPYGEHGEVRPWRKGDRYRDLSLRDSLRIALRRGKSSIGRDEMRSAPRQSKGEISMLFGLDASGSMRGDKLAMAKKAGIALAARALERKDPVGLIVFGSDVREAVAPTHEIWPLLRAIGGVTASRQTDFVGMMRKAIDLFPKEATTKHLVIITDAMPTIGDKPEQDTLQSASEARSSGITLSIVGIRLDKSGKALAENLVRIGDGRLYIARQEDELDRLVLEDYEAMQA